MAGYAHGETTADLQTILELEGQVRRLHNIISELETSLDEQRHKTYKVAAQHRQHMHRCTENAANEYNKATSHHVDTIKTLRAYIDFLERHQP